MATRSASGKWLAWTLPLAAIAALLALSAPPWPDDWDGIGFLASIDRFDLDRFAPHPPGYPVYVVLLRIAGAIVRDRVVAANAVAIASGVVAVALLRSAIARAKIAEGPWLLAIVSAPLVWRASSAIGSEAPALACAALAMWGLARRSALVVGIAVGVGLGVRVSWAPLLVPMLFLVTERRARAWMAAACATAAWLIPFVAIVGPTHLVALLRAHFAGHAARWGGTALTEPGAGRVLLVARDLFVDGVGVDADALGIAIGAVAIALAYVAVRAWLASGWRGARAAAIVLGPYALWIVLGQNLRQQPRHALPLVVALVAALAITVARASASHVRALGAALFVLVAARTFLDARARHTTPPPGAQLAAWMRDRADAVVFGGTSIRFFESTPVVARAAGADTMGDVALGLSRRSPLPSRVYATGEVLGASEGDLVAELCRPPRIDRRAACLRVYDVTALAR